MQISVSDKIIQKWISNLKRQKVDEVVIDKLRKLAKDDSLEDEKKLKQVIAVMEENYAKNQIPNS